MKSSIDHLPPLKQRELARTMEVLIEEFEDALKGGTADFKKRGRILKFILFGSYARGSWVDEPHTRKGYRSDFDLLVVVNNRKLTDFATYWRTAADRLMREVNTPVSFIVHSRREVNTALKEGQYFFVDIRREGIVLYELDDEPLAIPTLHSAKQIYDAALGHFSALMPATERLLETAQFHIDRSKGDSEWRKDAAFSLHQAIERAYATFLLTSTNYSPPSHNIKFLRGLAEDQAQQLAEVWPRDQQRFVAWFNIINEAYVKARYSRHFEITKEALSWLSERVADLIDRIEKVCRLQLERLNDEAEKAARRS
ncbi:MAG: HEPN domain-containing protein [Mesorhizobium sp.]|uniref:nucleotidyltransferase and HEPN domain-containing protein n=1 Tax=Mesorhizobium sp. TaxID=1871066 RepID=UPI000FE38C13|nr:nucleotidyltransferase and HEPN domain-containing protein [Mesorhizobium sp.]RWA62368.1 MAG: HEPN domain-containing protein [Mesorhizobium sp.]RWB94685.1 MAG: HEPN domain-containing protein [Mesorhizobium sp.]RWK03303.1 MAG: HEPN domain-containing protein [Mesorhizobium sp.]RWK23496.1 MAG: HEPN domain-containing protein [Mesorhizobium sp.]RWK30915.1 MAG: HEPN domain-containing protein [Mesorhizobium sp.]